MAKHEKEMDRIEDLILVGSLSPLLAGRLGGVGPRAPPTKTAGSSGWHRSPTCSRRSCCRKLWRFRSCSASWVGGRSWTRKLTCPLLCTSWCRKLRYGSDRGMAPLILEEIMKVISWFQFVDKVVDVPVGVQRQGGWSRQCRNLWIFCMFRSWTRLWSCPWWCQAIRAGLVLDHQEFLVIECSGGALTPGVQLPGVRPPVVHKLVASLALRTGSVRCGQTHRFSAVSKTTTTTTTQAQTGVRYRFLSTCDL